MKKKAINKDITQMRLCKATKKDGTPCRGRAMAGFDYCHHHLEGEIPKAIAPATGSRGIGKKGIKASACTYGGHIHELITPEEVAVFERYWNKLHEDFDLNESVDDLNAENACIMQIQLHRAIKAGDVENQRHFETMLRNQLNMLKVSRLAREGLNNTLHVTTMTPAEWAAKMVQEGQNMIKNQNAKYNLLPDIDITPTEDGGSESEDE